MASQGSSALRAEDPSLELLPLMALAAVESDSTTSRSGRNPLGPDLLPCGRDEEEALHARAPDPEPRVIPAGCQYSVVDLDLSAHQIHAEMAG